MSAYNLSRSGFDPTSHYMAMFSEPDARLKFKKKSKMIFHFHRLAKRLSCQCHMQLYDYDRAMLFILSYKGRAFAEFLIFGKLKPNIQEVDNKTLRALRRVKGRS